MARADYTHTIEMYGGLKVIAIEDLNLGKMSVTNNIEEVVNDIEVMEKIDANEHLIVYKDSEGIWDGFDWKEQRFIHLGEANWQRAVRKWQLLKIPG